MSPLLIIFITVFIDLLGFGIIIPLLPFYAEHFGASALMVGLLSSSFSLAQFLFAPFWGRLSDRIGRRPVILIGLLGSALSYAFFALATSLPMLFLARSLAGIAGANIPTAQAFIADTTTAETRARGNGIDWGGLRPGVHLRTGHRRIPQPLGLRRAGVVRGGALTGELRCCGVPAARVTAPARERHIEAGPYRSHPARGCTAEPADGAVVYFLVVAAFASFEATFALYSERRFGFTPATIGYMFAWIGVVLATVQGVLVGRVVKRIGEKQLVPLAIFAIALALGFVPVAGTVPLLAAVAGLLAMGMGFNSPSMLSAISQLADARDQGSTLGVSQSLGSLARIIGPLWGGWVFDEFGIRVPILHVGGGDASRVCSQRRCLQPRRARAGRTRTISA